MINCKNIIIKMVNKIEIMEGTKYNNQYKIKYQIKAIKNALNKINKIKEVKK